MVIYINIRVVLIFLVNARLVKELRDFFLECKCFMFCFVFFLTSFMLSKWIFSAFVFFLKDTPLTWELMLYSGMAHPLYSFAFAFDVLLKVLPQDSRMLVVISL